MEKEAVCTEKRLAELIDTYDKLVFSICYKLTGDYFTAEDLTQETFLQAFQSMDRFAGSCKISVWLCQIARHLLYRHLEKHKHEIPMEPESESDPKSRMSSQPLAEDTTWKQTVTHIELIDVLKEMQKLPANMREVMYLRITGELSFKEIGQILGRSENWARVNFYRGKELLLKGRMKHESHKTDKL